ncbi:hypothetical protein HELRODRAFT_166932 [Helobdella robusta]|uniref:Uncharacterized protein n=1 Tax=Helobdella robusta TaxID=6412 RepID=T1EYR7_HELRO|nr:hypothetical protein HELRODRAFT_166932 [Helobdella robusta]ESO11857.1 hypothetical protein HELRODRAFT_166932 [Helobdella robusta]
MAQWLKAPGLAIAMTGFEYKEIPAYHMQYTNSNEKNVGLHSNYQNLMRRNAKWNEYTRTSQGSPGAMLLHKHLEQEVDSLAEKRLSMNISVDPTTTLHQHCN